MNRTKLLQELRQMRFEEIYEEWNLGKLTQAEAARVLGVCDRSFRRYIENYKENGLEGLVDHRIEKASHRCAPVDEVCRLEEQYRRQYSSWNVKHFYSHYYRTGGTRSYTWVKDALQRAGLVTKAASKGKHRRRRERSASEGMMIHQDGSTHEWVEGVQWDLISTMDDATSEHYSMFFVDEEGTASSFQGVSEIIEKKGLFCSFYSDRGSHYWSTPEAGGKVDKVNLTQFGRALKQLGIEMIPAYSPEARGRSERAFRTHQGRLPNELKQQEIVSMAEANRYLRECYMPAFNVEFKVTAKSEISAFVPYQGGPLVDVLCEQEERMVGKDNCVQYERLKLQIPADRHRMNYVKVKVRVHRYMTGDLAVFHGPRCLARYYQGGDLMA